MKKINRSGNVYLIVADRETSQFEQTVQDVRCNVLEAHRNYVLVESLKRYDSKYSGASVTRSGVYKGLPVRRINKDQILRIKDEETGQILDYNTVRRREGTTQSPGRFRRNGR